jgi:hypothetical protein
MQVAEAACPSMRAAQVEATRGREELKLANYDAAYPHFKRAARIEYECVQKTSGYAHDWIDTFYAEDLIDSVPLENARDAARIVNDEMNNLAAGTKFADVRATALQIRGIARKELKELSTP